MLVSPSCHTTVHPRERGESLIAPWHVARLLGPSPRARGIPLDLEAEIPLHGSIPASAGNPCSTTSGRGSREVHPRERGESRSTSRQKSPCVGPSPRARGIRGPRPCAASRCGSIPASAGNPQRNAPPPCSPRVHPRERGESASPRTSPAARSGPSPRARGIRSGGVPPGGRGGSIPASAGNPRRAARRRIRGRVHPRERGESVMAWKRRPPGPGPSPRARGIPGASCCGCRSRRSIPASAGNPESRRAPPPCAQVHPRERGESVPRPGQPDRVSGPSPRARGIPVDTVEQVGELGSIPASAGNPDGSRPPIVRAWVHPRERGESHVAVPGVPAAVGPSPRARGILARDELIQRRRRSIPASAGNPCRRRRSLRTCRVHPRERGESFRATRRVTRIRGPSPRARGIPSTGAPPRRAAGSIPASAGNPVTAIIMVIISPVHPRERGESRRAGLQTWGGTGPSPRARGIPAGHRS